MQEIQQQSKKAKAAEASNSATAPASMRFVHLSVVPPHHVLLNGPISVFEPSLSQAKLGIGESELVAPPNGRGFYLNTEDGTPTALTALQCKSYCALCLDPLHMPE